MMMEKMTVVFSLGFDREDHLRSPMMAEEVVYDI